ncbi:renalase-like isoform X2 [Branchiostoma floridae]|uniref:Renalase-like isoform X2 n=1 Tax=Branchiostoma floridae TaxID=7739 RepID=A0A9J7KTQ4_BRAFL|nr:renalase-like isoform X2 [Branchiostoma floridae]
MARVLIVGAGLTGAVSASLLRRELQQACSIVVWDKARGAGGRMSTSRCPEDPQCTADLGAQYVSATPDYAKSHASFYEDLLSAGVLKPLSTPIEGDRSDPSTNHYVAPAGISSVVKHFLKQAGGGNAEVHFGHQVSEIRAEKTAGAGKWRVAAQNGTEAEFDAVVLTMPVPQILGLAGVKALLESQPAHLSQLEKASYSSRYALALYFSSGTRLDMPWAAKYVNGDPCVRFLSVDSRKRGIDGPETGPALVVHTGVPFGLKYIDQSLPEVQPIIMQHLRDVLPGLPEPLSIKCQKWRYSQVHKPVEGSPGALVVSRQPPLVLGGDAFTHSNFDGCIESALSVVSQVKQLLTTKS